MKFSQKKFLINTVTIFPQAFKELLDISIIGNARKKGIWDLQITDIKNFTNKSNNIDDKPYGGGPGMILRPDVVEKALLSINSEAKKDKILRIFLTPSGKTLNQKKLTEYSKLEELIILCGRFEGVDQRAINVLNFEEISLGDYILAGGESAAQVLVEGCIRLIPGVLGQPESLLEESFSNNLLEYPQFTRPKVWEDANNFKHEVPEILTSGHHEKIKKWRHEKSIEKTNLFRPDLLKKDKI